jgi:hypothetical protein
MKIDPNNPPEPSPFERSLSFYKKIGNQKVFKKAPFGAADRDRSRGKRTLRDFRKGP